MRPTTRVRKMRTDEIRIYRPRPVRDYVHTA